MKFFKDSKRDICSSIELFKMYLINFKANHSSSDITCFAKYGCRRVAAAQEKNRHLGMKDDKVDYQCCRLMHSLKKYFSE